MNRHAALLSLAVFITFAAAQACATVPAAAPSSSPGHPARAQSLHPTPPAPPAASPANPGHFYTVSDLKGLVLTCIAPELATNPDTDIFKNCTLAPGRTLDDLMHTFIQGIHYEQAQHQKEREEWLHDLDEKPIPKPVQK